MIYRESYIKKVILEELERIYKEESILEESWKSKLAATMLSLASLFPNKAYFRFH